MISQNVSQTTKLAQDLAKKLHGGEVLALSGDLGSGKTTFTQALAAALKIKEKITSPTFVMLKCYPVIINDKKVDFVHIDAYRLESKEDFQSIGAEDYLNKDNVIMVIEWAEKVKDLLPKDVIWINFKYLNGNEREIAINYPTN